MKRWSFQTLGIKTWLIQRSPDGKRVVTAAGLKPASHWDATNAADALLRARADSPDLKPAMDDAASEKALGAHVRASRADFAQ
jgi:hypothetical protein